MSEVLKTALSGNLIMKIPKLTSKVFRNIQAYEIFLKEKSCQFPEIKTLIRQQIFAE